MIKIESSNKFTAPKSELTKSGFDSSESEASDGAGESAENNGEFARVLENLTVKKDFTSPQENLNKSDEKEINSKHRQSEKAEKKMSVKEKPDQPTTAREDAAGAAASGRTINNDNLASDAELSVPPARAIMHIADLERIVSSVRAQTFDGNSQIVITLKNSVCSGLQIKLTTDDKQRVTAEFIAANEKVKAQIDARSNELADLLRQRGLKLSSLQTSVNSDASGNNENRQNSRSFETATVASKASDNPRSSEPDEVFETTETASNYRV